MHPTPCPLQTKTDAFTRISEAFASTSGVTANVIANALWAREKTQNTSVGYGVALPHATMPGISETQLGVFTLETPMDYQAIDGAPVDVFIVTLGPPKDRRTHLLLLATISKLILHTDLLADVRAAENETALRDAFKTNLERLETS